MGKSISKMLGFQKPKIVIFGLDSVGKTTLLYMISPKNFNCFNFVVGKYSETLDCKNSVFIIWDPNKLNVLMNIELNNDKIDEIIYVVDSSCKNRVDDAKKHLFDIFLIEDLADVPLLILANKQDIKEAMSVKEIEESLELDIIQNRPCRIVPTWAIKANGINEGIDWLSTQIGCRLP